LFLPMAQKNKFYVVWKGAKPGVYFSWAECQAQVAGFPGALFKGFPTLEMAQAAFANSPSQTFSKKAMPAKRSSAMALPKPIGEFLCVDASWITTSGASEYRGVLMPHGEVVFSQGPFPKGTNNVVEFLALVHGLAWCKQKGYNFTIYSDSRTALAWLFKKKANTKLTGAGSEKLLELLDRAENWLVANTWENTVRKWETEHWGEIPADYGRK